MTITGEWRRGVAKWLAVAELDVRLAQETHDGTERARRRYQRAMREHERALAEAEVALRAQALKESRRGVRCG